MSPVDPTSGRFRAAVPDGAIRAAARRVAAGESLSAVALDVGFSGPSRHRALRRRIDALAARDVRDAALRRDSRDAVRASGDLAAGRRPEDEDGARVLLASDLTPAEQDARHRARRAALARAARETEELSDAEYYTQWLEANDVRAGRKTVAEVMQARAAGRRAITPESTRSRLADDREPRGLIYSPQQLLAAAFTGRL